ncbi:hypothetical protein F511_42382 [Dorcoceras hygrometricum]|uniref:Dystroglycan-like n=1 Tax=Dorcoceras hygrometricum TaxID=472368 RepID=A0A2Z7D1G9_9LAMI|nr:hypothetical protein F511_42382 [Dorcoceras hygrometricum]
MASSLFVNIVHVCFEYVLAMDNVGMVAMFESLVDTGLKGFMWCPAVINEAALLEFFANGSVKDGLVVSTVNGVTVEISEQLFLETFELPVEGLTDLLEIPKDLVFDARSIVSLSGEPVSMSGKNKETMIEFRLLCDILPKTISVKAGSFDEITQDKFLMLEAITCGVSINWNRLLFNIFKDMVTPGSRQAKGYAIQISLLLENVPNPVAPAEQPPVPKRKSQKRKRRLILSPDDEIVDSEPVVGGSIVGEAAVEGVEDTAEKDVGTVVESVSIFEAETAVDGVNVETVVESVDEPVSFPAVENVLNKGKSTADDVDVIIEQVIAETAQLETDEGKHFDKPDVSRATAENQAVEKADEVERWFDLPYEVLFAGNTEQMFTTVSDTDEEFIVDQVFGTGVEKMETEAVEQTADEAMSLEDILMTIPVDCSLPSTGVEVTKIILGGTISIPGVNEGDWYKAGLPKILAADKGKAPFLVRDPVKGNPIKERFSLILADIEVLVMLREQIIYEARKINFTPGEGSSATDLKVLEMLYDLHMFVVEELKEQTMAHNLGWEKTCCSKIFEGRPRDRGAISQNQHQHSLYMLD